MSKFLGVQCLFPRRGHPPIIFAVVVGMFLFTLAGVLGVNTKTAFASSYCSSTSQLVVVESGDSLSAIAERYHTNWQAVAAHNHIGNPDLINVGQRLCIPYAWSQGHSPSPTSVKVSSSQASIKVSPSANAVRGQGNPFPYGQCTWWASNRYHQLTGIYVPWTSQSDAWEWTARAYDFHWNVSSKPSVGAIMDLQPEVQGAYGLGHVGVVEKVLSNGHVIASSMNWGSNPSQVTDSEFIPGSGVTFITF